MIWSVVPTVQCSAVKLTDNRLPGGCATGLAVRGIQTSSLVGPISLGVAVET